MLDLNKYSGKDKSELFHSSGHARLGFGDQIGSVSNQTFNQRLEQQGRKGRVVGGYHHSKVGAQRGSLNRRSKQQTTCRPVKRHKPAPVSHLALVLVLPVSQRLRFRSRRVVTTTRTLKYREQF